MSEEGDVAIENMASEGFDSTPTVCLAPGPTEGVAYPLKVTYCGACSMPFEYCEYSGMADACRVWATEHAPELLEGLNVDDKDDEGDEGDEKKKSRRGGRGIVKPKVEKKKPEGNGKVTLLREPRGKKSVTVIKGLAGFDIDLKVAAKTFSQKFACGSSVRGTDEIVIQGDVKDDLFDLIPAKWPVISEENIEDLGEKGDKKK
ncbi:hypothetical protein WR25_19769 [Diploscapter pachys]|uniref:Density-regulated protein n=1 Tax=Diploscapter pachys TaxID=2018661 RepID=A0A2A2L8B3_9BILA|nr:hypothetical protein WR25_19769 [Diploscapter pachys]